MMIKAITLYQPWASLVALDKKRVETRSWPTNYRGTLAIHAGKSKQYLDIGWQEPFYSALAPLHSTVQGKSTLGWWLGYVVAICELVDCRLIQTSWAQWLSPRELAFGDYTPGRYAWILKNIEPLEKPISAIGKQGLWDWDMPVEKEGEK